MAYFIIGRQRLVRGRRRTTMAINKRMNESVDVDVCFLFVVCHDIFLISTDHK
jgi:hypothetical protein